METDKAPRNRCRNCNGVILQVWGDWFHYRPLSNDKFELMCPAITVAEPKPEA